MTATVTIYYPEGSGFHTDNVAEVNFHEQIVSKGPFTAEVELAEAFAKADGIPDSICGYRLIEEGDKDGVPFARYELITGEDHTDLVEDLDPVLSGVEGRHTDELVLDIEDGGIQIFVRTSHGSGDGVPVEVWDGRCRRTTLATGPCVIDVKALGADLIAGGRLSVLIDRIQAGLSVYHNGSNWRGSLNADAEEAEGELESLVASTWGNPYIDAEASVWDELEWVYDETRSLIKAATTDEEIDAYLERVRADVHRENVYLQGDARDDLIVYRNEQREEAEEADAE